jgi:hypothetical protein
MTVSKGRRSRRPGGHPAKVAARRERTAARGSAGSADPAATVRRIVRDAAGTSGPLQAELWASRLLGGFWERRRDLPIGDWDDYALVYGEPLVEAIAMAGGPGALTALTAIAAVDDAELGMVARKLAERIQPDESVPSWLSEVGEAQIVGAAAMREDIFDDGATMLLEARHPGGEVHAIGVYIDNNLGVMAKDILLANSIEAVAEIMEKNPQDDGRLRLEPVDPPRAAAEIRAALGLTDMTLGAPVSEDFAALRALALLRSDETPGIAEAPERDEIAPEERDALRDEFLASAEGREFEPDGDGAYAVSLAIDFCCGYVDGRPLRWSPVTVELFMADWVPRKVIAGDELFEVLPAALDAWVRFAGRKRGTPAWAIELTREAIPRWRGEMEQAGRDPAAGGPAKQFVAAARAAGVDLADEEAVNAFVAGWNARSTAAP